MYKIDDEFRPRGRVFMKATRETSNSVEHQQQRNVVPVPVRKSSLKKGPAITTNLDDRSIQFQHEVTHEKSVEALITEYPPHQPSQLLHRPIPINNTTTTSTTMASLANSSGGGTLTRYRNDRSPSSGGGGAGGYDVTDSVLVTGGGVNVGPDGSRTTTSMQSLQEVTRNKRTATEILGSSYESKKLSQRDAEGHRRITTHVVRKVTTMSRAEENAQAQNLVKHAQHNRTTEFGYVTTQAIGSTSASMRKVEFAWQKRGSPNRRLMYLYRPLVDVLYYD